MAGSKKPQKSYAAKARHQKHLVATGKQIIDPLSYVLTGLRAAKDLDTDKGKAVTRARIVNHESLDQLRKGTAKPDHLDNLVAAFNLMDALRLHEGLGEPHAADIKAAQDALLAVMQRYRDRGAQGFVCTGPELQSIIFGMEIHDAQLEVVTVGQVQDAIALTRRIHNLGMARKVKET